ncbi:MAG: matrixin family metalloprotease [Myxococcota bacterium]
MLLLRLVVLLMGATLSSSASAFRLLGSSWDADHGPISFHLEPTGSADIDDDSDLDAVRSAFRRWSCVPGSRLRFVEGALPGVLETEPDDGRNSVFWDEEGRYGLGPGTLGITVGPVPTAAGAPRTYASIVFNGVHHTWSTDEELPSGADRIDVESIAVHEVGHFIGLDHPCVDAAETDCLGPELSVMHPAYPGGIWRSLRDDDEAGARALYPQVDNSSCEGPFRQGEACTCSEECVESLVCVGGGDGPAQCSARCSSSDISCPVGTVCVLHAADGDDDAHGLCEREAGVGKPPGAVCERDDECLQGLCARSTAVARTVCRVPCDVDGDCSELQVCAEGACLPRGPADGISCVSDDEGCACTHMREGTVTTATELVALFSCLLFTAPWCRKRRRRLGLR